ncbi:MAG: hypothetical protein SVZ03_11725 [Spirochaetota bacterium]|nr:hypothetical protein [Spirochaetota bacterium]
MDEKIIPNRSIGEVPNTLLKKLTEKRIYFGHQSVGFNIIDGINDIIKENSSIKLNIVKTDNIEDFKRPIFAHSQNGINKDPKSKVDAFTNLMEKGLGDKVDIAFFKFCYVDILNDTNVNEVFNYYKSAMMRLKNRYPKTLFIHVTVPLMREAKGPKAFIKSIIGRDHNIVRNQFNDLLREEYDKNRIFDLARFESTYPKGQREARKKGGKYSYSLIPEYTDDGGHLNEKGRKIIAEQFLIFLSEL